MRPRWGCSACLLTVAGACGGRVVADTQRDAPDATGGAGTGRSSGTGGLESVVRGGSGAVDDTTTAEISSGGGQSLGIGGGCASLTVQSELTPVNLILIYDKSGSMGVGDGWDNTETRWNPMRDGLLAFLGDPWVGQVYASLEFFPANGDLTAACNVPAYEIPTVPLVPLHTLTPETSPFAMAINATTPGGGTPTLPALLGSLNYAREVMAEDPGAVTVVILATDGEPGFWIQETAEMGPGCTDPLENTVENVATIAGQGLEDGIPTYVIGIGDTEGLQALHQIALAGGTESATIVVPGDPAATTEQIRQELESIRSYHLTCNIALPGPMPNLPLDYGDVSVVLTMDGSSTLLSESAGCEADSGWQYLYLDPDLQPAPSHIELCPTTCQTVHASPAVEISVSFGCAIVGPY